VLPRRTASNRALWQTLFARFDRIVVHSEHGRRALADVGVDACVIAHPVFPSDPPRADDGRTVLSFGVIRPYKGLGDAIAAVKQVDGARLLVAGDPLESVNGYRAQAATVRSGVSATSRPPRSSARAARRPSPSFRTGRSAISA